MQSSTISMTVLLNKVRCQAVKDIQYCVLLLILKLKFDSFNHRGYRTSENENQTKDRRPLFNVPPFQQTQSQCLAREYGPKPMCSVWRLPPARQERRDKRAHAGNEPQEHECSIGLGRNTSTVQLRVIEFPPANLPAVVGCPASSVEELVRCEGEPVAAVGTAEANRIHLES